MKKLVVMKFGGTSVGGANRIYNVAKIIANAKEETDVVVVVSAMGKVTDLLTAAALSAGTKNRSELANIVQELKKLHKSTIDGLELPIPAAKSLHRTIGGLILELESLLTSVSVLGELTPRAQDLILSFGERFSCRLVAEALNAQSIPAKPVDAQKIIITDNHYGAAHPILEKSQPRAKRVLMKLLKQNTVPVVTGFIGATTTGITTTLGRGGSDYSATLLGNCLNASRVYIWTDVDGAMTADPRIISEAHTISTLSYSEAAEIAYFGAKVLHPLTMVPASLKKIPIVIKNTMSPAGPGTVITSSTSVVRDRVKAISVMRPVSLIIVQGKGMSGMPGIAAKVFSAIALKKVNVLFISQASSECNISIAVSSHDADQTAFALKEVFDSEIDKHLIENISVEKDHAILTIVGDGMKGYPGIAGKAFSCLGANGINIVAIAQGSSDRSISLVISSPDTQLAVQSLHDEFELSELEPVS